jgi:hypothetical protein
MRIIQPVKTSNSAADAAASNSDTISPTSPSLTTISRGSANKLDGRRRSLSAAAAAEQSISSPTTTVEPNTGNTSHFHSPALSPNRQRAPSITQAGLFDNPTATNGSEESAQRTELITTLAEQLDLNSEKPTATNDSEESAQRTEVITKLAEQLDPTKLLNREKRGLTKVPLISGESRSNSAADLPNASYSSINGLGGGGESDEPAVTAERVAMVIMDAKQLQGVQLRSLAELRKMKCPQADCQCNQYNKSPFKNQCANCFHAHE